MAELEKEKEAASLTKKLGQQMKSLANPSFHIHHGPDTVAHLQSFSLESILQELSANAPDVLELIEQLGDCGRCDHDDNQKHIVILVLICNRSVHLPQALAL